VLSSQVHSNKNRGSFSYLLTILAEQLTLVGGCSQRGRAVITVHHLTGQDISAQVRDKMSIDCELRFRLLSSVCVEEVSLA
jgi:hypothetical protein